MNTNFRLGRTIVGDSRKSRELKLRQQAERKKRNRRKIIFVSASVLIVGLVGFWVTVGVISMINEWQGQKVTMKVWDPSVQILDENHGTEPSARVKEFVAKLENDMKDYGLVVDHVVLPFQKAREVDVYLNGRTEYYKMSIDRGSAVQAEDAWRMARYLDEKGIVCAYVDLRVEGKAYYK